MKFERLFLALISILFLSCTSTKKNISTLGQTSSYPKSIPKSTDDGLSYSTAIVITETSEATGPHAEYEWIKKHYSNYKIKGQALTNYEKKPYDIITIVLSDDKELPLYFDISNYFGKF